MPVTIKGFLRNSLIEWEGLVASVLYLPGCNFRCHYCHTPDLLTADPDMRSVPLEVIERAIQESNGWLDGVVVSGGEPTIHSGLPGLLAALKHCGVKTKLNTNGGNPEMLRACLAEGLLDAVALDVKAPLDDRYERVAGVPVDLVAVHESIMLLLDSHIEYEFRTTVCPQFTGEKDVLDIARELRGAADYVLQPFRPVDCLDPALNEVKPYLKETLDDWAAKAAKFVKRCRVR
jgi:pyruvate formate lyase activating enzyme